MKLPENIEGIIKAQNDLTAQHLQIILQNTQSFPTKDRPIQVERKLRSGYKRRLKSIICR